MIKTLLQAVSFLLLALPAFGQPSLLSPGDTELTLTGLTPGGEILWAWVERTGQGAFSTTSSGHAADVADGEGTATLERPDGVPSRAVYAALDVERGRVLLGLPEGYEPQIEDLPPGAVVAADPSQGQGPRLRLPRALPELILLRPGRAPERGAWIGRGRDGESDDEDGLSNGVVELAVERLLPLLGEGPPPETLRGRDVVLMLDLETLTLISTDLHGRVPTDGEPGEAAP